MIAAAFVCVLFNLHLPQSAQDAVAVKVVEGARKQLSWGTTYNSAYVRIPYPNGDVPKTQGVCTDVVVRAFRNAGFDLQKLVHEDMKTNWALYPRYSGNKKPDSNIDHRRCPNLVVFFKRFGKTLSKEVDSTHKATWRPGDLVFWKLPSGLDHVGVLTDKRNAEGLPFVIHNLAKPAEEDVLEAYKIVGHYRYPKR